MKQRAISKVLSVLVHFLKTTEIIEKVMASLHNLIGLGLISAKSGRLDKTVTMCVNLRLAKEVLV